MRTKTVVCISLLTILALAGYSCGGSGASPSTDLKSLVVSDGTLTPQFSSSVTSYAARVAYKVPSVTVTPTAENASATITVQGDAVGSGTASAAINFAVRTTTITIIVTAQDKKTHNTYTIDVTHLDESEAGIGSPCYCDKTQSKNNCENSGVPVPNGSPIIGCENVPTIAGAVLVCFQSFDATTSSMPSLPSTHFPNGYCSLGAIGCTPCGTPTSTPSCSATSSQTFICASSSYGTFNDLTACTPESVLIQDTKYMDLSEPLHATLNTKVCAKSCNGDSDCRTTETDPVFSSAAGQYQCINKNTSNFCYDPSNLSSTYTAP